MPFNQRLKELRLQNNLSQEKISRKFDITTRTYAYYEAGQRYPPVELLIQFADFFGVSIPFLLDRQDERQAQGAKQLIEGISDLFAGSELSEAEKDAVMEALQEVYQKAKEKNNQA